MTDGSPLTRSLSIVIGRRITADPDRLAETGRTCKQLLWPNLGRSPQSLLRGRVQGIRIASVGLEILVTSEVSSVVAGYPNFVAKLAVS